MLVAPDSLSSIWWLASPGAACFAPLRAPSPRAVGVSFLFASLWCVSVALFQRSGSASVCVGLLSVFGQAGACSLLVHRVCSRL
jgi:hypothetical protein